MKLLAIIIAIFATIFFLPSGKPIAKVEKSLMPEYGAFEKRDRRGKYKKRYYG